MLNYNNALALMKRVAIDLSTGRPLIEAGKNVTRFFVSDVHALEGIHVPLTSLQSQPLPVGLDGDLTGIPCPGFF